MVGYLNLTQSNFEHHNLCTTLQLPSYYQFLLVLGLTFCPLLVPTNLASFTASMDRFWWDIHNQIFLFSYWIFARATFPALWLGTWSLPNPTWSALLCVHCPSAATLFYIIMLSMSLNYMISFEFKCCSTNGTLMMESLADTPIPTLLSMPDFGIIFWTCFHMANWSVMSPNSSPFIILCTLCSVYSHILLMSLHVRTLPWAD